ncbi:MAG: fibro-slime domain-containing protein [Polyangiales bacterium]
MTWKRIMLSSALLVTLACGDSETDGPLGDGGGGGGGNGDGGGGVDLDGGIVRDGGGGNQGDGGGIIGGDGGEGEDCDGLKATIRDFKNTHPDFQAFEGAFATTGLVNADLGTDRRPVYTGICEQGKTLDDGVCPYGAQTSGKASFDQWYVDVAGVNQPFPTTLPLTRNGSSFEYNNSAFFPIDGKGWGNQVNTGNEMQQHNFHFTTEVRTSFTYGGGEVFEFTGDDDLWIFVNGKLALDLGGLHQQRSKSIDFDAQATKLGIEKGKTYRMDIFHAERRTSASNFKVRTNIECFKDPPVVI